MPIFAGIIAAIFAYLFNMWTIKRLGDTAIIIIVPFIEEVFKTLAPIIMGANIIIAHLVFGLIEGVYDIVNSPKRIGKWAALVSVISHSVFGIVTYLTISYGYSIYWAILLAWLLHSSWNWYITKHI